MNKIGDINKRSNQDENFVREYDIVVQIQNIEEKQSDDINEPKLRLVVTDLSLT